MKDITVPKKEVSEQELAKYEEEMREYEKAMASGWENIPYNEFLDLVTQKIDPDLDPDHPVCPFCNSSNVAKGGESTTLLGWTGDINPNHRWADCSCKECNQTWTIEIKGDFDRYNVWYTKDKKVLRGIPTCFEHYAYTCRYCDGDVIRHYFNKNTRDKAMVLAYNGNGEKSFDTFFVCEKCKREVKSSSDYYSFGSPHRPRKPINPQGLGWVIREEIGTVIVNDYGVTRVQVQKD